MDSAAGDRVDQLRRTALHGSGVLAGRRRRRAVGRLADMCTPEAARALAAVYLATTDAADDAGVRDLTRQALTALADPAAVDAACEVAIATGDQRLQDLLGQAGHLPSHPARRAMWLFLTGDFDAYTELDHDGALLRAAHQAADPTLRRRIAETARTAGRVEWVRAVVPRPDPDRLTDLTGDDWDATLSVLTTARRFDELWRLAHTAPLPQAARILHQLARHGWQPEPDTGAGAERDGYAHLLALADRCAKPLSAASLFTGVHVLGGSSDGIKSNLAVSRRGDLLARTSQYGDVWLWHLPSGESAGVISTSAIHDRNAAVSPDSSTVAISDYNDEGDFPSRHRVKLFSVSAGGISASWSTSGSLLVRLAFTPDGELLVGSDFTGRVWLWHVPSGRRLWTVKAHGAHGSPRLAVTPDGRLLVTAGTARGAHLPRRRATLRLWELPSGKPAGTIDRGLGMTPLKLLVTSDGRRLVTFSDDRTGPAEHPQVWDLPSLTRVWGMSDMPGGFAAAMSPDGKLLIGVYRHGDIEVRRTADGELVTRIDRGDLAVTSYFSRPTIAVSPDGRLLLGAERLDATVHAWHLPSGEPAGTLSGSTGGDGTLAYDGGRASIYRGIRDADTLMFASDGTAIAQVASPEYEWGDRVVMWRSEPVLTGRTPIGEVTPDEAERLRQRTRDGVDRAWGELLAALVHWRHRHDIDLADAAETKIPSPTDIEASG